MGHYTSAWADLFFSFNLSRTISLGADPLQQPGALKATWDNDFLGLSSGAALTFLVPGFQIVVTPLGLAEVGASNFAGSNPWVQPSRDVEASFEVTATAVPDSGSALVLLGSALLGLSVLRRRFGA